MKTAIIIGATSGIGRQLAISLLEDGWRVGIAGRREYKLMEMKDFYGEDVVVIERRKRVIVFDCRYRVTVFIWNVKNSRTA